MIMRYPKSEVDDVNRKRLYFTETIRQNTNILDQDSNWNGLLHKDDGLKATREHVLFR